MKHIAGGCLGLFVVGQLFYLVAANILGVWQFASAQDDGWPTAAQAVTERWADLTGQPQNWSLFAPEVDTASTFAAVELRWDDGIHPPVLLLSDNEPDHLDRFFRFGRSRLRRYESLLIVTLQVPAGKEEDDVVDGWRERIVNRVRRQWGPMFAYLRWRWIEYQQQHPHLPLPKEVRLLARTYAIGTPGGLAPPLRLVQRPLARRLPESEPSDALPIEAFNPVVNEFDPVVRSRGRP
ncbi:MAG: hypothetical protein K2R98_13300 [Gemmataceae bacterium]|nr:hypothetical protein [Gemmataceae bacterium]